MKPPPLHPGDLIGVMAPSSFIEAEHVEKSKALLEELGYKVFIHPQTFERLHQSAGTVLQKSLAFQGLWQRDDINAIWAAGGGNRALTLLESINFEKLKAKPKTLIGFSDITALLTALYAHTGIQGVHGPIFKFLHRHQQLDHLLAFLRGENPPFPMEDAKILREGTAEGPLIGGNLSVFHYLPHTLPGEFWKGAILFLEDCNEEISRIDRMFIHLKRTGVLKDIAGLVLGEFTDITDSRRPFGFSLEEIVQEHTQGLNIPIIMNAPFGHGDKLYPLRVGARARLETNPASLETIE
ncbi:MAG: LD-carboxypeptidase [Alphaproteobacteria bacterium]|nr:LD-carboxypeptidase [Alphaproteobacteria bacterium]